MSINKKYIVFILFLFSTANALPTGIDQFSRRHSVIGLIGVVGILIISYNSKHIIKGLVSAINKRLCQKVFGKTYPHEPCDSPNLDSDDYSYSYNLNTENIHNTQWYIEKYGSIIRILLKFLLFVKYTSTQHSHADYIHTVYKSGKYTQAKSIVQFLFDCGIDPRYLRVDDRYLLTQVCHNNDPDSMELMEYLLIKHKIDPNHRDSKLGNAILGDVEPGYSPSIKRASDPLCVASYRNNNRAVQLLISCNTDSHPFLDCDPQGNPPIVHAIKYNNTQMFRDLFLYTVYKTNRHELILKHCLLTKKTEGIDFFDRACTLNITRKFIGLIIKYPSDSMLMSCFECNEKIWLPHPPIAHGNFDTSPARRAQCFYSDKKPKINYDTWKANLKSQVKEFLPQLQISS